MELTRPNGNRAPRFELWDVLQQQERRNPHWDRTEGAAPRFSLCLAEYKTSVHVIETEDETSEGIMGTMLRPLRAVKQAWRDYSLGRMLRRKQRDEERNWTGGHMMVDGETRLRIEAPDRPSNRLSGSIPSGRDPFHGGQPGTRAFIRDGRANDWASAWRIEVGLGEISSNSNWRGKWTMEIKDMDMFEWDQRIGRDNRQWLWQSSPDPETLRRDPVDGGLYLDTPAW